MSVMIRLDNNAIAKIEKAALEAAVGALELLCTDLISSELMPFDTGDMQNNQTYVEPIENGAVLITGSPQARRLYYHPEYNFQRGKNANAGAYWLEPYITDDKKDFVQVEYERLLKERI